MTTSTSVPQRLYLMQVASLPLLDIPIPCYLIQTSDGKNILIDSGLPSADFQRPPGKPAPVLGKNVIEQLDMLGVHTADIDLLICTHFDLDHVGYNDAFPKAELIVQRRQYEVARAGNPRFAASLPYWDLPVSRYRMVVGETQLLPGLQLIETSGHVPGHQSVLVSLPTAGPVLLTIDAVANQGDFTLDRRPGQMDADPEEAIASTRKLLDLARHEHVSLVIFGHDGLQWKTLKKLPDFYS
jgi:N-acyl homoserine lactone hydrolase